MLQGRRQGPPALGPLSTRLVPVLSDRPSGHRRNRIDIKPCCSGRRADDANVPIVIDESTSDVRRAGCQRSSANDEGEGSRHLRSSVKYAGADGQIVQGTRL